MSTLSNEGKFPEASKLSAADETTIYKEGITETPYVSGTDCLASFDVKRISSFLSGEIDVPDDLAGCKLLCGSSPESTSIKPLPKPVSARVKRRRIDLSGGSTSKCTARANVLGPMTMINPLKEVKVPIAWETCLLVLWEHIMKHAYITQQVSREAFVERIKRISAKAARSLNQRGFFTLKHLLGAARATKVYNRVVEHSTCRSELPGRVEYVPQQTTDMDPVAQSSPWSPKEPFQTASQACVESPDLLLLSLYIDTIVQATRAGLMPTRGSEQARYARSRPALAIQTKTHSGKEFSMGSPSSYNKNRTSADGRFLVVHYYVNPVWKIGWGGHVTMRSTFSGSAAEPKIAPEQSRIVMSSQANRNVHILPTLDRLLMFYTDDKVLLRVHPMRQLAEVDELYTVYMWYHGSHEDPT